MADKSPQIFISQTTAAVSHITLDPSPSVAVTTLGRRRLTRRAFLDKSTRDAFKVSGTSRHLVQLQSQTPSRLPWRPPQNLNHWSPRSKTIPKDLSRTFLNHHRTNQNLNDGANCPRPSQKFQRSSRTLAPLVWFWSSLVIRELGPVLKGPVSSGFVWSRPALVSFVLDCSSSIWFDLVWSGSVPVWSNPVSVI